MDLAALRQKGIRGLIVDLDNTLGAWHASRPTTAVAQWLQHVQAADLRLCIVSNGGARRVQAYAGELGVPCVGGARKPSRRGFRAAMSCLGTAPAETAVVGDQIFTDVFGGNRLGLYTILVLPVGQREFVGTRLMRLIERMVLRYLHVHPARDSAVSMNETESTGAARKED